METRDEKNDISKITPEMMQESLNLLVSLEKRITELENYIKNLDNQTGTILHSIMDILGLGTVKDNGRNVYILKIPKKGAKGGILSEMYLEISNLRKKLGDHGVIQANASILKEHVK